jgi:hypothetical protein
MLAPHEVHLAGFLRFQPSLCTLLCAQPQCAGTELATYGYQFFAYLLNGPRPMYINSLDGKYR